MSVYATVLLGDLRMKTPVHSLELSRTKWPHATVVVGFNVCDRETRFVPFTLKTRIFK